METNRISQDLVLQLVKQSRLTREFAWLAQEDSLDFL